MAITGRRHEAGATSVDEAHRDGKAFSLQLSVAEQG
jgi:hypothetical protein